LLAEPDEILLGSSGGRFDDDGLSEAFELGDQALDLALRVGSVVRGWMTYYGRFYRSAMAPLLLRVSGYLRRWAGKKYRRLRTYNRFKRWWAGLLERDPGLFAHWLSRPFEN
jgi:hypothetical protein